VLTRQVNEHSVELEAVIAKRIELQQ
jgi:hypothetical protein